MDINYPLYRIEHVKETGRGHAAAWAVSSSQRKGRWWMSALMGQK